jgi:hypothetical protein
MEQRAGLAVMFYLSYAQIRRHIVNATWQDGVTFLIHRQLIILRGVRRFRALSEAYDGYVVVYPNLLVHIAK